MCWVLPVIVVIGLTMVRIEQRLDERRAQDQKTEVLQSASGPVKDQATVIPTKTEPSPTPTPTPAPQVEADPAPAQTTSSADAPNDILDLSRWKLALPIDTDHPSSPDHIQTSDLLNGYSIDPYFMLNTQRDGVVFRAHAGGATTKNSNYPRSEMREMKSSTEEAKWSNTSGTHTMTIRQAITHLPVAKPEVVAGQVHDGSDDVIMIRLEGNKLIAQADSKDLGTLDANYKLGTVFTVGITAKDGGFSISYNGKQMLTYKHASSSLYFKAGCYTQSNTEKGDDAGAYGEVVIYDLDIGHTN